MSGMAQSGAPRFGRSAACNPTPTLLPVTHETQRVRADGRPQPAFRDDLRRIPSWRNAWAVLFVWIQTIGVIALAVWWGNPVGYVLAFLLMGRADAQFAALMHEAAHRLLFVEQAAQRLRRPVDRGLPDLHVDRRLPARAHGAPPPRVRSRRARHPALLGLPDQPGELPPQARARRDRANRVPPVPRPVRAGALEGLAARRTLLQILLVQAVLLGAAIAVGKWWLYPLLWVLPYVTVWRVINRLRAIAEHGGMNASSDRRETTHTVKQHALARFVLVPYHIGWHLPHHVDAGVPMRALAPLPPGADRGGLRRRPTLEYANYPALWRALRAGT